MGTVKTERWDVVDYLRDDADLVLYLEAALEDSDAAHVAHTLVNIARARGALDELEEALRRCKEAAVAAE
ncbi:MAG: hypothetical protein OXI51_10005 [Chloroflexota bacterium]|nr:hypothetical protein [Chloroflexota bacterium]